MFEKPERPKLIAVQLMVLFTCALILIVSGIIRKWDVSQYAFPLIASLLLLTIFIFTILIIYKEINLGNKGKLILLGTVLATLGMFFIINIAVPTIGNFEGSAIIYTSMAVMTGLLLIIDFISRDELTITWARADLRRDALLIAGLFGFIFFVTFMFSVANNVPLENEMLVELPFSATQPEVTNSLWNALISFSGGVIESMFFITFLGILFGFARLPHDSTLTKIFVIIIMALIMATFVSWVHTGYIDISQGTILGYITVFFFTTSSIALYLGTSLAVNIAHGLIDGTKRLAIEGEMTLFYLTIAVVMGAGIGFFFFSQQNKSIKLPWTKNRKFHAKRQ